MNYILSLMLFASLRSQGLLDMTPEGVHVDKDNATTAVKKMPTRLSALEIRLRMQHLPDWTTDGKYLFYTRTFENFVEGIAFVNSLVEPAEQLGHHPDIIINYNRISLELTTHDVQGLTDLDFQLATQISQL